jgi:hypothetical protein
MIKDLLQSKFAGEPGKGCDLKRPTKADLRSRVSDKGDPRKNSERLRVMLPKIKFPLPYDEKE